MMIIRLLLTGGTIDKAYNELTGTLEFDKPHIGDMLKVSRHARSIKVSELFQIDSLDMDQTHRNEIAAACKAAQEDHIIITHGTDTMPETAQTLFKANLKDKVIVLTGAMVPYSFGVSSDAMFNLGTAVAFVQSLPPGVYIAMNGRCFDAMNVRKDKSIGQFVKL